MKCFVVAVLLVAICASVVLAQAKRPAYLRLCSRSDPQFDKCMVGKVQELLPNLLAGDPELGLPSLNPVHIDELRLDNDITEEVKSRLLVSDLYIHGTDSAKVTGVSSTFADSRVDLDVGLIFPRLVIEGNFRSDVRFRGLPFINKGAFNISLSDVSMTMRMEGKTYQKAGEQHLQMQHVRMRPEIGDLSIYISNLFGGAKDLSDVVLSIANRYWFIFYNENLPVLEERWDPLMTGIMNSVLERVPFDHIFPQ
ncbi:uncharacterized protein LOC134542764 [Bacillus rossius redtenbacheri]|uniref:uncharacterized protein LOC134542764 n=1 Tax=Bacillus rossius redtenbacheri TaxID=93214 RepID=UPI002FDEAF23